MSTAERDCPVVKDATTVSDSTTASTSRQSEIASSAWDRTQTVSTTKTSDANQTHIDCGSTDIYNCAKGQGEINTGNRGVQCAENDINHTVDQLMNGGYDKDKLLKQLDTAGDHLDDATNRYGSGIKDLGAKSDKDDLKDMVDGRRDTMSASNYVDKAQDQLKAGDETGALKSLLQSVGKINGAQSNMADAFDTDNGGKKDCDTSHSSSQGSESHSSSSSESHSSSSSESHSSSSSDSHSSSSSDSHNSSSSESHNSSSSESHCGDTQSQSSSQNQECSHNEQQADNSDSGQHRPRPHFPGHRPVMSGDDNEDGDRRMYPGGNPNFNEGGMRHNDMYSNFNNSSARNGGDFYRTAYNGSQSGYDSQYGSGNQNGSDINLNLPDPIQFGDNLFNTLNSIGQSAGLPTLPSIFNPFQSGQSDNQNGSSNSENFNPLDPRTPLNLLSSLFGGSGSSDSSSQNGYGSNNGSNYYNNYGQMDQGMWGSGNDAMSGFPSLNDLLGLSGNSGSSSGSDSSPMSGIGIPSPTQLAQAGDNLADQLHLPEPTKVLDSLNPVKLLGGLFG